MVNKWVMVVDSEAETLGLIDGLLRRRHIAVIKAQSAELALHLVKSVRPDAFVLDVALPDMDGFDLCRILRSTPHTASIPVVMIGLQDQLQWQQAAHDAGADQFLIKRALPGALLSALDCLLVSSGNGHSNGNGNGHGTNGGSYSL